MCTSPSFVCDPQGLPYPICICVPQGSSCPFAFYCAISDGGLAQLQFYGNKGGYAVPIGVGTEPRADTNVRLYYDHLEVFLKTAPVKGRLRGARR